MKKRARPMFDYARFGVVEVGTLHETSLLDGVPVFV